MKNVTGVGVFRPFGVFVMLGQDYLPNRIGTASGLTVGLSLTSQHFEFATLIGLPALAMVLSTFMREPPKADSQPRRRCLHPTPSMPTSATTRTRAKAKA